jgi:hypothetical protein
MRTELNTQMNCVVDIMAIWIPMPLKFYYIRNILFHTKFRLL